MIRIGGMDFPRAALEADPMMRTMAEDLRALEQKRAVCSDTEFLKCPQCGQMKLREMTDNELECAVEDWDRAGEHLDRSIARICENCHYEEG
jgi:hypothetical protein